MEKIIWFNKLLFKFKYILFEFVLVEELSGFFFLVDFVEIGDIMRVVGLEVVVDILEIEV